MIVPLTLGDFLVRAEGVYCLREAVAGGLYPLGGGLGLFTGAPFAVMERRQADALDDLGLGVDERAAIVSPNASRFLIRRFFVSVFGRIHVRVNFRLNAAETS